MFRLCMETWNDVKYDNFILIYVDTGLGVYLGTGHLESWGLHGRWKIESLPSQLESHKIEFLWLTNNKR